MTRLKEVVAPQSHPYIVAIYFCPGDTDSLIIVLPQRSDTQADNRNSRLTKPMRCELIFIFLFIVALLTIFTGGKCLLAIVTGTAIFSLTESLHGQSVAPIRTALLFLEHDIMAIGTTRACRLVTFMTEYHWRETFGVIKNDVSDITIRPNCRPTPQQTARNEYRQTQNPHSNFHVTPFSNNDLLKSNPLYPAPGSSLV